MSLGFTPWSSFVRTADARAAHSSLTVAKDKDLGAIPTSPSERSGSTTDEFTVKRFAKLTIC